MVVDVVPLHELGAQHQAHGNYGNPKDAFLVDFSVLETAIVMG